MINENATQIVNLQQGLLYINGAVISNNVDLPATALNVSPGIMRDSTNTFDLNIGNFNGQMNPVLTANTTTVIYGANVGLNGIDTGALEAATLYKVYVVADPVSGLPAGAMISKNAPEVGPVLPFGYSVYRHIGYIATAAGAATFLLAYNAGNGNARRMTYDAPQATAITAGTSTSYVGINLAALVPTLPVNQIVQMYVNYLPAAANNTLNLQPANATGAAQTITGQAAASRVTAVCEVNAQIIAAGTTPQVRYRVSSASDSVAVSVAGFDYFI